MLVYLAKILPAINFMFASHNQVISLIEASSRRQHIAQEFGAQNIPFAFFDAVSPANKLEELLETYPNFNSPKLSAGEKSCLLSHFLLWQQCVEQNLPYLSIFEDDVILGENAAFFLQDYSWLKDKFAPEQAFILRLETFLMHSELERVEGLNVHNRHIDRLKSFHYGTAGYIVSQPMAKFLLDFFATCPQEKIDAVDEILFNRLLEDEQFAVYQLNPAICVQELQLSPPNETKLGSLIEQERTETRNRNKPKKTLISRVNKIKYNIWRVLSGARKQEKLCKNQVEHKKVIPFK